MSEYIKTTIIECNQNNSILNFDNTNDFAINTGKPLYCPKGTQISLDGAIIKERGATNTEVIELTDQNYSNKYPYTNTFMGMEILYYINHNGQNMCAGPIVAKNGMNADAGDDTTNTFVVVPRQKWWQYFEYLILDITGPLTVDIGEDINYIQECESRDYILYDERTNADISPQVQSKNVKFRFMKSDFQINDGNNNQMETFDGNARADVFWNDAYFAVDSPASMATGVRKNRPNGEKWVYISNQFDNPIDESQKCLPFTSQANIDLGDNTHNNPDQLNFLITDELQRSQVNAKTNIVDVKGVILDVITENKLNNNQNTIFNFSGTTIKNIPANLQSNFESQYYSNMFVKDYKWWLGGQRFLTTTCEKTPGLSPNAFTIERHEPQTSINNVVFNEYNSTIDNATFFPRIYGLSILAREPIFDFGNNEDWLLKASLKDGEPDFLYSWVFFSGTMPDGSDIPIDIAQYGFTYTINQEFQQIVDEDFFLGKINTDNCEYNLELYRSNNLFNTFLNTPSYIINIADTDMSREIFYVQNIDEGPTFNFYMYSDTLLQVSTMLGSVHNGLPYYSFPGNNCGGKLANEQPTAGQNTKKIADDFTAIPRGYIIPSNIMMYPKDPDKSKLDSILKKIQTFFRENEIYIGNKATYEEQQRDWKNWLIEVQIGFHNDNAISNYNARSSFEKDLKDLDKGGGVTSFSFYEQWFSGLAYAGELSNANPALNHIGNRQSAIYPAATYTTNGENHRTNKNVLRLMTRYNKELYNMIRINNFGVIRVSPEDQKPELKDLTRETMCMAPCIRVDKSNPEVQNNTRINELLEEYNIACIPLKYIYIAPDGIDKNYTHCFGFVNALDTFGGDGCEHNDDRYNHIYENNGLSNITSTEFTVNNVFDNDKTTFNTSNNVFNQFGEYNGINNDYNGIVVDMELTPPTNIGGVEVFTSDINQNSNNNMKEFEIWGNNNNLDDTYYKLLHVDNQSYNDYLGKNTRRFLINSDHRDIRRQKYYNFEFGNVYEHSQSDFLRFSYVSENDYRTLNIEHNQNNTITTEKIYLNSNLLSYTDSNNILYTLDPATGVLSSQNKTYTAFEGAGGTIPIKLGNVINTFTNLKLVIKKMNGGANQSTLNLNSLRMIGEDVELLNGVNYSLRPPEHYRQSFRLLCGTVFGFDPSATASPWGIPLNNAVTNAEDKGTVQRFRNNDYQTDILYSSYIENYINNIFIGAPEPNISFSLGKEEFAEFHTPKRFNNQDGGGAGADMGDTVAVFNDTDLNYQTIQVLFSEDKNIERLDDYNFGIFDSVCGIGIYKLFVRDKQSIGVKIGDVGTYECILNNDFTTQNYKNCLFDVLGFDLIQLLPIYGRPYNRYQSNLYNKIGGFGLDNDIGDNIENLQRYKTISFFTTNSIIGQNEVQLLSLFPPNFPDDQADDLRGLPDYNLSYMGFVKYNIKAESDTLIAKREAVRVRNPYYIITTDLPTTGYFSNENNMSSIGYAFKQYRTANYYFQYTQNFTITLTNDLTVSKIRTAINDPDGRLSRNIDEGCVFFYKFQFPLQLTQMPEDTKEEKLLKQISSLLKKMNNNLELNNYMQLNK